MLMFQTTLALMAACVAFAVLARRARVPYAVVLILGGMALAFVPGAPRVVLDPGLALAFFLPPLLQASAWRTDWRDFRRNLRPILLLAVGCVLFTAACVAVVAKLLLPELPWAAAVALGAIVAPPDAVAAAAVLSRLPIPRRIVSVLSGESLVNDASALVLYRLALGALALGSVSPGLAALSFVLVSLGGIAFGLGVALLAGWVIRRLSDTLLEVTVSFLAAYAAFLGAEALGASGVIAVVTTGVLLARNARGLMSARTRVDSVATWRFAEFVLTSLVFILVGLQLNGIVERLGAYSPGFLLGASLAVSATLVVSRFLWVFPATYLPRWLWPPLARRDPSPPASHAVVVSWSGMRGVVSLAAALALPLDVPERDLLIFLSFVAILATLVLQGTTLEGLIRRLGVRAPPERGMPAEEAGARRAMSEAAVAELRARLDSPLDGAVARDLLPGFEDRARLHRGVAEGGPQAELRARLQLRLAATRAARARLLAHHAEAEIEEEALSRLLEETDLEELRLSRQLLRMG